MLWLGGMFTREGAGVTPLRLQTCAERDADGQCLRRD